MLIGTGGQHGGRGFLPWQRREGACLSLTAVQA